MTRVALEKVRQRSRVAVMRHRGPFNVVTIGCMIVAVYFAYDFWISLIDDDRINLIQLFTAFLFLFGGSTYSLMELKVDRNSREGDYYWYNSWVEDSVHPYLEELPLERMNDLVSVEYDHLILFKGKIRDRNTPVKVINSREEVKLAWAEIIFDENIATPYFEYRELKEDLPYDTRWQSMLKNTFITDSFLAGLYHARIYTNDPMMMPEALKEAFDKKNAEKWAEIQARSNEVRP